MHGSNRTLYWPLVAGLCTLLVAPSSADAAPPYAAEITPGELRGIAWQFGDPWPSGYWEYLPNDYNLVPPDFRYPMLMTLGGIGTTDDPSNCPGNANWCTVAECEAAPGDPDGICRVYRRGPAVEIRQGVWDDVQRPFIVIQPQNMGVTLSAQDYDRDVLDDLAQYVVDNYPVDPRRLYLLGNSQGGRAILQYTSLYNRRMAAVTMGPGGMVNDGDAACRFQDTAFWAFHGENDDDNNIGVGVFDPCWVVDQLRMYNEPDLYPTLMGCVDRVGTDFPEARLTMFDNTAHNAWTPAYENVTNGFGRSTWAADQMCGFSANFYEYSAALDPDGVYSWMLSFDRPDTDAGSDFVVPGTEVEFTLEAITTDDDAVSHTWTQVDGPPVTLTDADQAVATVTDFDYDQIYTFEVYALDADSQWDRDEVVVTVEPEVIAGSSTGPGDSSDSSESVSGSASTSGGADATTGDPPPGTTSGVDTTAGPPPGTGGSGPGSASDPGPGSITAADSSGGDSTGMDTVGAGDDGGSGCGCRVRRGPGWMGLLALLGLVAVRRRRVRD